MGRDIKQAYTLGRIWHGNIHYGILDTIISLTFDMHRHAMLGVNLMILSTSIIHLRLQHIRTSSIMTSSSKLSLLPRMANSAEVVSGHIVVKVALPTIQTSMAWCSLVIHPMRYAFKQAILSLAI